MDSINITQAGSKLFTDVNRDSVPIKIINYKGKRHRNDTAGQGIRCRFVVVRALRRRFRVNDTETTLPSKESVVVLLSFPRTIVTKSLRPPSTHKNRDASMRPCLAGRTKALLRKSPCAALP